MSITLTVPPGLGAMSRTGPNSTVRLAGSGLLDGVRSAAPFWMHSVLRSWGLSR